MHSLVIDFFTLQRKVAEEFAASLKQNTNADAGFTIPVRLPGEYKDLQKSKDLRDITVDETFLHWSGIAVPDKPPYNKGAFKIKIDFPADYPYKPPKITFLTKIYHPNIDEQGQVNLAIINAKNWKPATKTDQVIQALVALVHNPEPENPLRADLAEEYIKDKKKFFKNAEDFTKKHSEKRPSD